MSLFPDDDQARKMLPIFAYLTRYFPKAHREVTKVCVVNNVRYNPDREPSDIAWNRGKSKDQLGSGLRHMLEAAVDGKVFESVPEDVAQLTGIERVYVLAEAMWRIGAELELTIERTESGDVEEQIPSPPLRKFKIGDDVRYVCAGQISVYSGTVIGFSNKTDFPYDIAWRIRGGSYIQSGVQREENLVAAPFELNKG